jgi:hypothetical protein
MRGSAGRDGAGGVVGTGVVAGAVGDGGGGDGGDGFAALIWVAAHDEMAGIAVK